MKRVLILGVNGFIGHHLSQAIIADTDWEIYGMDMQVGPHQRPPGRNRVFIFSRATSRSTGSGSSTTSRSATWCCRWWPLPRPATYVREPLRVFELDFEANLPIVRPCVRYKKRLVFPSTSEVYGMSRDAEFDPETLELVLGPINKPRWIYPAPSS